PGHGDHQGKRARREDEAAPDDPEVHAGDAAAPAAQMNSMTGFGGASQRDRRMDIDVEVRSVNHRFLTLKQSLPDALGRHEGEIEQMVRARIGRGSVTVNVSVKTPRDREPSLPDLTT